MTTTHFISAIAAAGLFLVGTAAMARGPASQGGGHTASSSSSQTDPSPPGFSSPGQRQGWDTANPPGWDNGKKEGWDTAVPPGFDNGDKKGWDTSVTPAPKQ